MICCFFSLNYSHYLFPPSIEQNEVHDAVLSFGLSAGGAAMVIGRPPVW